MSSRPVFIALLVVYSKLTFVLGGCLDCTECNGGDGQLNGTCKCDGNCDLFGDCCESVFDLSTCAVGNSDAPPGVDIVCIDIYPDKRIQPQYLESFWMVSSCPSSWSDEEEASVRKNCIILDSSLPPITDLDTGGVYANEYCAVCNGVENLIVWQPNLGCTVFVYEQIELLDYNITKLLEDDPTIFETQCQTCLYQIPTVSSYSPRPCISAVSTCVSKSELEERTSEQYSTEHYQNLTRDCVTGPYDIHTAQSTNYRNNACAICNGEDSSTCIVSPIPRLEIPDECILPEIISGTTSVPPEGNHTIGGGGGGVSPDSGISFTIALSNLGEGQVVVTVQTETVTVIVECPEGQAALGLECRPTLCPEGYVETGGQCAFVVKSISNANISVLQCLTTLVTLNSNVTYILQSNDSVLFDGEVLTIVKIDSDGQPVVCLNDSFIGDFVNCPTKFVVLNETEYVKVSNNTVQSEGIVYEVIKFDAVGSAIVCPPNETTINETSTVIIYSYASGYLELTYIGCSLSVIGSALVLLTYGLFKSLRTLPSLILMNLSAAILANNLFILIGGPITQAFPSVQLCATVAICLHFFFLAQFMWMSIMSFQMAKGFHQAWKLKMVSKSEQKSSTMVVYFLIGWGTPFLIVAISIIVNFSTQNLVLYGVLDDGKLGSCWINHLESAIISFIVPLIVSMVINFTLFVIVTVFLCHSARSSTRIANGKSLPYFRVNVAVFSVTGLTWVFGFVALLAGTNWAWYPFIIFNSTQGFMIFITFILTKRVLKLYWKFLLCRNDTVSKSTKRTNVHSPAGNEAVMVNMNTNDINGQAVISYTTTKSL